jgi:N-acetylneuraminic acid mutarotase
MSKLQRFYLVLFICVLGMITNLDAQWTGIANYKGIPNDGCFTFTINSKVYVGGGNQVNDFYEFDHLKNTWTKKANIGNLKPRAWAGAYSINNVGYVIGGDTGSFKPINDHWAYFPETDKWEKRADFPGGNRDGMLVFTLNGEAYVGGGFDGKYIQGDFYKYNPQTDTWSTLNYLPFATLFPSIFKINNEVYFTNFEGAQYFTNLLKYDPINDTWIDMEPFPGTPRSAGVAYTINNKAYVGLGQTSFNTPYYDIYSYDPSTNTWSEKADTVTFKNVGWSLAFSVENTAYIGTGVSLPNFEFSNKFYKKVYSLNSFKDMDLESQNLIYPNPANSELTIDSKSKIKTLKILNLLGQEITNNAILGENQSKIDLNNLQNGVYYIQIENENGLKQTEKLVKISK